MKYNPKKIESKWQKKWEKMPQLWQASDVSDKKKFYCLAEFPYPSGEGLHVGHVRGYAAMDIISRKKRMQGFNVLFPMGWDAFGLPTENYAIKTGTMPQKATEKNVKRFKKQMQSLGLSFDWSREINTSDPNYYKWTQWIFLKLFENDLAYKAKIDINWCPSCKIGLANEEVIDNKCERCGTETEKKKKEQWLLKITKYADRLIDDLSKVDFPEKIKSLQTNWIGRSDGAEIEFKGYRQDYENTLPNAKMTAEEYSIPVFTTRPDTIFGATFIVLSPEHPLAVEISSPDRLKDVEKYIENAKKMTSMDRLNTEREKTGVFTGAAVINPMTKQEIQVWVADYVLYEYGTGAIMAVPGHDSRDYEFAKKFGLEIKQVIAPTAIGKGIDMMIGAYEDKGFLINSEEFNGLTSDDGAKKITSLLESQNLGKRKTNFHLRDWIFSRQHYWGEPIPIVFCENCGYVPIPESELPLKLPKVKNYQPTDTGESPLSAISKWVNTKCPKCGGKAKRETDTMPNWAGSSWYFLRYCDPNNTEKFSDKEKMNNWIPVDLYNGGMEHTTLHLLYSRFWHKFLFDIKEAPRSEPFQKRISHGMILAENGMKMSKSKGNVINPDDVVSEFGADTLRSYEMFMGPYEEAIPWDTQGIKGLKRFLEKIWGFIDIISEKDEDSNIEKLLHKTIKKVTEDIDNLKFNTAVSSMMILANEISKAGKIKKQNLEKFILILSVFAPHIAEEMWELLGHNQSVFEENWPSFDTDKVIDNEIEIPIQINGKLRDRIILKANLSEDEIKRQALESEKVKANLEGKEVKKVIVIKGRLVNIVV